MAWSPSFGLKKDTAAPRNTKQMVNPTLLMTVTAGNFGVLAYVMLSRAMRRNNDAVTNLEKREGAKLQLESPEYKCYFAAQQYRLHQCLDVSLHSAQSHAMKQSRAPQTATLQEVVREQVRRKEVFELRKAKQLAEEGPDAESDTDLFWFMIQETFSDVYSLVETGICNSTDYLKSFFTSDEKKEAIRTMQFGSGLTGSDDINQQLPGQTIDENTPDVEWNHMQHCRNLDSLLNRCAGELYYSLPDSLPAMQPLPFPFNTTDGIK